MSLLSWLNWYKAPTQPFLPDPNKEGSHEAAVSCEAANEEIARVSSGIFWWQKMPKSILLLATNFGKQLNLANSLVFAKLK